LADPQVIFFWVPGRVEDRGVERDTKAVYLGNVGNQEAAPAVLNQAAGQQRVGVD
jgi:hypothetical protein